MSILKTGIQLTKRSFLVSTLIFFSFFSWYFAVSPIVLRHIVGPSAETYQIVSASFNFVIATTFFLSSFFIHRFNKILLIYEYFIVTSMLSILLLFISSSVLRLIIFFGAGIFFSLGQLSFFTYFWSLAVSVEKGRASGLMGFFALPIAYFVSGMAEALDFFTIVMLGVIISSGTLAIKLLRKEKKDLLSTKKNWQGPHPEKKTIFLYSLPWMLFSLINVTLARNISLSILQNIPSSLYMVLLVLQITASGFGALGGGIIADLFGRRLSLGFALTLYGISSAIGGFFISYELLYFMYFVNGLSWGILMVMYFFVIWGDLANKESCSKMYSIGLLISYLAMGIGLLLSHQISRIPLIVSSLLSCVLIFLSNIPLVLAPELLSSDFRERIRLKLYINVIKRIRGKQSQNQG